MEADPTIVEYTSGHERYKCGYCHSEDTNFSHGMWAHQMTVQDYQDLIDRGWRRSGMYCYKPTMQLTCCPQYTIKCDAVNFQLNKSHKKVIRRVNKFLISGTAANSQDHSRADQGVDIAENDDDRGVPEVEAMLLEKVRPKEPVEKLQPGEPRVKVLPSDSVTASSRTKVDRTSIGEATGSGVHSSSHSPSALASAQNLTTAHVDGGHPPERRPKPGLGPDPSKPKCRKAKEIRAERKAHKQTNVEESRGKKKENKAKSLEDLLCEPDQVQNPAHKLQLRLVRNWPPSEAIKSMFSLEHAVYFKYQTTIHKDPPDKPGQTQYKRFLCDSPLVERHEERGPPEGYGSFHQHYLLDGKLIAVAVLDILPACVSSVYLFYDPDYSFLSLGVYSALRELALVRQLYQYSSQLRYYYMGFYIHSCPKMRYKGQYRPSFLVCPETYKWVPIEKCRPKLDQSKYARLSDPEKDNEDEIDVDGVLVLYKGTILPFGFYKTMKPQGALENEVREYAHFVGKSCSQRMLLVRK